MLNKLKIRLNRIKGLKYKKRINGESRWNFHIEADKKNKVVYSSNDLIDDICKLSEIIKEIINYLETEEKIRKINDRV